MPSLEGVKTEEAVVNSYYPGPRIQRRYRFSRSLIPGKFTLNTTDATVEETMAEFVERIQPYLTPQDRMGLLAHSANLGV